MQPLLDKTELLKILRENRSKHQKVYEKALEGFQDDAKRQLESELDRIKRGDYKSVVVRMTAPQNHTRDYDRAIRMVQLHRDNTIRLSEQDAARYIEDDWGWKQEWLQNSTQYAAATVQEFYSEG